MINNLMTWTDSSLLIFWSCRQNTAKMQNLLCCNCLPFLPCCFANWKWMHNGCAIRFCGLKWETLSSGHTSTGNFSSQHSKSPSNHDTQWESVTSSPLKWMATGFHKCVVCFPNAIPLSLKDLSASSGMTICWWNIIPVISLYITVKSPHFSIGPSFDKSLVPDLPSSMDPNHIVPWLVFPRYPHIPMNLLNILMIFPWYSHDIPMIFPWYSHDILIWVGVSTGPKNFKNIVRFSGSGGGLTKCITKIQVACLCLYNDDPF